MRYALNAVVINGWITYYGAGAADAAAIEADGAGYIADVGGGAATVEIEAQGAGLVPKVGAGSADVVLDAAGNGIVPIGASGQAVAAEILADMTMPRPAAIPIAFYEAHPSRRIYAQRRDVVARVAPTSRTMIVAAESRTVWIAKERNV